MTALWTIVSIVLILVSIVLIVAVLMQQGQRQGLGAIGGPLANRARKLGAKRATVLSDQKFYYRIGFECSSEVYCWEKEIEE